MKRSEGWDIELRRKSKSSLTTKVFLIVFSALTICSMLIYAVLMVVLPGKYTFDYNSNLDARVDGLLLNLEGKDYARAVEDILDFCIENHCTATLSGGQKTILFGKAEGNDPKDVRINLGGTLRFWDREATYTLAISSASGTTNEITMLFLKLIPAFGGIVVLLSALSAWLSSKVIVSPIVEISRISRQMTSLDMSWRCEVKSEDEIGVLAESLNTMALRLRRAMEELEAANRQLKKDVAHVRSLELERRRFFAAVSHELKTPLTILKGQIENMMLGYGDYCNHDVYLPEAMRTVENMESLVGEILAIAKMESLRIDGSVQEVSLSGTVEKAVSRLLPLAQEKDIRIHRNMDSETLLQVVPALWDKVLSNIIGNAIRHSPRGAEVFIFLRDASVLVVENTGVAIPQEDFPRLFTPFYRGDKSRSRATGGSGLGLYTVKNILALHDMHCSIHNTEKGVAVELFLTKSI